MRTLIAASLGAAVSLAGAGTLDDAKERLAWNWQEGQTLRYQLEQRLEQTHSMPQMGEQKTDQRLSQIFRADIDETEDGRATGRFTFEHVKVEQTGGMMTPSYSFDSSRAQDAPKIGDPNIAPYAAMAGQSATFVIDAGGRVEEVRDVDRMVASALKRVGDAETAPLAAETIRGVLTTDTVKHQIETLFRIVPDREIEPGESWTTTLVQPMAGIGVMTVKATHTFAEVVERDDRRLARIDSTGEMSIELEEGALQPGVTMTFRESDIEGRSLFSLNAGHLVETESDSRVVIEIRVPGMDGEPMTMTQTQVQRAKVTLLPVE